MAFRFLPTGTEERLPVQPFYGAIDFVAIEFPHTEPAALTEAVLDLVGKGLLQIHDFIALRKDTEGNVRISLEDVPDLVDLAHVGRLVTEKHVRRVAEMMSLGTFAIVVAYENVWARQLGYALYCDGARSLMFHRVSAGSVTSVMRGDVLLLD